MSSETSAPGGWVVGDHTVGCLPDSDQPLPAFTEWEDARDALLDGLFDWSELDDSDPNVVIASSRAFAESVRSELHTARDVPCDVSFQATPNLGGIPRVFWIEWQADADPEGE